MNFPYCCTAAPTDHFISALAVRKVPNPVWVAFSTWYCRSRVDPRWKLRGSGVCSEGEYRASCGEAHTKKFNPSGDARDGLFQHWLESEYLQSRVFVIWMFRVPDSTPGTPPGATAKATIMLVYLF
jgi:hypothetical protein